LKLCSVTTTKKITRFTTFIFPNMSKSYLYLKRL